VGCQGDVSSAAVMVAAGLFSVYGDGQHFISVDKRIEAMKQTSMEMSHKY